MSSFIPASWWPAAALMAPLTLPWFAVENLRFKRGEQRALARNRERIANATPIDLEPVRQLELDVLVEWQAAGGFRRDPGVSYLVSTEQGNLLYDLGFGSSTPTFSHNARELGVDPAGVSGLAISHLHLDHMGGLGAQRARRISLSAGPSAPPQRPCYLPEPAIVDNWRPQVITGPTRLAAGLATPGPLARQLFFLGYTEEIALVAHLEGRGLVVFSGCGHPGLENILDQVTRVFRRPIHALVGGLHLPLTSGRGFFGIPVQRILGTGLPPWRVLAEDELTTVVSALRNHEVQRLLISAHDSCDGAITMLRDRSRAEVEILIAGKSYVL